MKDETLSKIGCYPFMAEPFHCDFNDRLFIGNLGNDMLNAADFHSNERGYGMHYLNTIHRTWVLSRLAIELDDMPKAYDKFNVETWVDGVMRYFTSRNFKVADDDGAVYGYGRSIWAMIDTESRQPTDILSVRNGLIKEYVETDYECPVRKASRVPMDINKVVETIQPVTIDTHYSDVDVNGHINSVKYIEHILDLWNLDWYKEYRLKRFEIAYVAESHEGDKLNFYLQENDDVSDERVKLYNILVTKTAEDGEGGVEVVRSNVKFVKD